MFLNIHLKIAIAIAALVVALSAIVVNASKFYTTREFSLQAGGAARTGTFHFEWVKTATPGPPTSELQVNLQVKNPQSAVSDFEGSVFLKKENGEWIKNTAKGPKNDGLSIVSGSTRTIGAEAKESDINADTRASVVNQAITSLKEVIPKDTKATTTKDVKPGYSKEKTTGGETTF